LTISRDDERRGRHGREVAVPEDGIALHRGTRLLVGDAGTGDHDAGLDARIRKVHD
jgi:hypothetical protein